MTDRAPVAIAHRPGSSATTGRVALLGLAIATWLGCFAVLRQWGTWTPFAVAGVTLAAAGLGFDRELRRLLRPSLGQVGIGLAAGVAMVLASHAGFRLAASLWPELRGSTRELYDLLNVGGFSPAARAGLVVVVATCEELLFRGALAGPAQAGGLGELVSRRGAVRIGGLAACYAAAMLTVGSPLLVGCALACGIAWGALRVATRSMAAPIVAHVIWDLGVLVAWPLV